MFFRFAKLLLIHNLLILLLVIHLTFASFVVPGPPYIFNEKYKSFVKPKKVKGKVISGV